MIRKGTEVRWTWGNGSATGRVEERFTRDVSRTIKGATITRHGTSDNPALLIRQEDGDHVLKLKSEVERA